MNNKTLRLNSFSELQKHRQNIPTHPNGNVKEYMPKPVSQPAGKTNSKEDGPFIVKCSSGLTALKYWLQNQKYNTFVETTDKNGNPMYGLLWDYELGKFPSERRTHRGLILVLDKNLVIKAGLHVVNHMDIQTEYGKQFQKAQRDLYKYGRC